MEMLAVSPINPHIEHVAGRRVFVTGHTGFKGSWLLHWLHRLGCETTGYALEPDTSPNLFELSQAEKLLRKHVIADVRDAESLARAVAEAKPELIIHLAAQPLVRRSYSDAATTWATNVMGTVNLLEAVRKGGGVSAVLIVTTDKVYNNNTQPVGYRETDALAGHDPYSASKAAAEIVAQSYRRSYFANGPTRIATARAGNVVGGGDWCEDRLVADVARAVAAADVVQVRNPSATRPWQHVLDCLSGYLTLCGALLSGHHTADTAYNFGPSAEDSISVGALLDRLAANWPALRWRAEDRLEAVPYEAEILLLDTEKARRELGWSPRWSLDEALLATAQWYRAILEDSRLAPQMTIKQLEAYLA